MAGAHGKYPDAERLPLAEALHGRIVEDPYRWLEDANSEETKAWCAAQDELWRSHQARLPGRTRLRERLEQLAVGLISAPKARAERQFFTRRQQGDEFAKLMVIDADGRERVLIDPAALSQDHTVTLDQWEPSLEGDRLLFTLSEKGDEEATQYVMDVASLQVLDGPIDRVRRGSVAWLPGSEAYYYVRRLPPDEVPPGEEVLHRRVYLHRIGRDADQDVMVFGEGRDKISLYGVTVSPDGRWLLIRATTGGGRNDLYIADLGGDGELRPIHEGVDAMTGADVLDDGRLYLLTQLGAPRRRICVADPSTPTPEYWRELVPEETAVIRSVAYTNDAIVVVRQRDVVSEVAVHDRATGALRYDVPLPGLGTAAAFERPDGGDEVWIGYSDFFTPFEVWHHDVATRRTNLWARPPGSDRAADLTTTRAFYASKDGTRIPMFIVHRRDVVPNGYNAMILTGYGGFNIPMVPSYSATRHAWVEQGGVFAIANIRGGNEYGEEWHRAGMRGNKQNCFDDFIAAAEWLIDAGWTNRRRLALVGGSNGGLLVGAVMTQRPDLCRAILCASPVLDSIRLQRFQVGGKVNIREYGDADVPEEFEWLVAYSPYHHVAEGAAYPAVLFTQGEADTRVDPLHARKMCAAVQWATSSDLPVLLRAEQMVGHAGRSMTRSLDQAADTTSWLAQQLGLPLRD